MRPVTVAIISCNDTKIALDCAFDKTSQSRLIQLHNSRIERALRLSSYFADTTLALFTERDRRGLVFQFLLHLGVL
jgi:hypothetical protein